MQASAVAVVLLAALLLTGGAPPGPDPSERGRHLALNVARCIFCHSEIDWKADGFPPRQGAAGGGRAPFSDATPWLSAPNLTPDPATGALRWSDEQLDRAVRQGIGRDGQTLHPAMPYARFRAMSDDDLAAIAAYLRSLPPVRSSIPPTDLPAGLRDSLRPLPPAGKVDPPDRSSPVKAGEYLASIAACGSCHTPADDAGRPIPGMDLAGGVRLKGPWGDLHSPNITPDASGIQCIGESGFVHAMKTGQMPGRTLNAVMPWPSYRHWADADLRAVHAWLETVRPVRHFVDNTVAPTPCVKCGRPHGLGNRN